MRRLLIAALAALLIASPVAAKPIPNIGGGTLTVAPESDLTFGGFVTFDVTLPPDLPTVGITYISVVCSQDGAVAYQWSSRDLGFDFPLVTQPGLDALGIAWHSGPGDCEAWLLYAEKPNKQQHTILRLADVTFEVA
jgi:hypothetical protein